MFMTTFKNTLYLRVQSKFLAGFGHQDYISSCRKQSALMLLQQLLFERRAIRYMLRLSPDAIPIYSMLHYSSLAYI